ncbi:hypothetical protein HMPREF1980_01494 [Actinomyces sp. oral taxon 172 str. F0311]|nr:hypothetical protein HMPREF1980_01494 [Actinomyces sp. oral taxon 172 str. F0311]
MVRGRLSHGDHLRGGRGGGSPRVRAGGVRARAWRVVERPGAVPGRMVRWPQCSSTTCSMTALGWTNPVRVRGCRDTMRSQ